MMKKNRIFIASLTELAIIFALFMVLTLTHCQVTPIISPSMSPELKTNAFLRKQCGMRISK